LTPVTRRRSRALVQATYSEVRGDGSQRCEEAEGAGGREPASERDGCRFEPGQGCANHGNTKKRLELVSARRDVALVVAEHAIAERYACRLLEVDRSTCRYEPRPHRNAQLREALWTVAKQQPRYGYRRLWALPVRPNQEWAMDFVSDALATGRALRTFNLIDAYTKESPAIEVGTGISSRQVARVLERVIGERGLPGRIRCDNGPEFTSLYFVEWCKERGITLVHIQPGKPVQNGTVESFNGRFRDECLNANWFVNLADAKRKIDAWRKEYNGERPHSSLAYRTPDEFAGICSELTSGMATGR
jgi:putative transposase